MATLDIAPRSADIPASPSAVPTLPADENALAATLLIETEAAERARIRALEALVIGLALGCLYFLLVSPIWRPLTTGDLMVVGSLTMATLAFFAFYHAAARAHGAVVERAEAHLRHLVAARQRSGADAARPRE